MATLSFVTAPDGNGNYVVTETSVGVTFPPYTGKRLQIVALDGTYLYNEPVPNNQIVTTVPITSDWTTHLGITQIVISFYYYKGQDTESVFGTYTLPTTLNIKTV